MPADARGTRCLRLLDGLAFSSSWIALAAALLCAAASRAMGVPLRTDALLLAFAGTLVVYNVDRLRDLERDRFTAPLRSAFVEHHRGALLATVLGAGAVSVAAGVRAGGAVVLLAAAVLAVGLLHRRLKAIRFGKAFYLAGAWTAVVVGLPVLLGGAAEQAGRVAAVLYLALFANAVGSSVRDREAGPARIGLARGLLLARGCALLALLLATFSPPPARHLLWIPLLTAVALAAFRQSERYGLLVLDGALVAGATLSLLLPV